MKWKFNTYIFNQLNSRNFMEYIAKTIQGTEEATIKEVKEILNIKSKKRAKKRIQFETNSIKKFIKKTRTSSEVYLFLKKFNFKNQKDIITKIKNVDFKIKKDFVVRCSRSGNHDFTSLDLEKEVGEVIYKKGNKVNLKSKEIIYLDLEDNVCFLGKLMAKDLCKRYYRFHIHNQSINACLASSLIKISGIKPAEILVDPFCKDSVILIEAYKQGIKKIYGFDPEQNNIRNSKINSKLAKTRIKFSRLESDWLDTKFKKNSIKIITNLPFESKRRSQSTIKPILKEFFHQARYVARSPVVALTQKPKLAIEMAKKENFSIQEKKLQKGDLKYSILILTK